MLIDEIRAGETDTLEFKRDVPSDKMRLLKTACAFANCNGGRIVVGVDDDRTVVGVDEMSAFKLADQLVDTISNGCEPLVPASSEIATADGKTVIVLTIQMGLHCPYHVKSAGVENGTFVRVGATSRCADEDSLKELEIIGRGRSFDAMACRGLDVSQSEISRLCAKMYRLARANCDDDVERRKIRRVEVTSPGGLPHGMSLEMMGTGHSRSRNKALALAFKYMNFIEEWGSGIPRIQELLQKAGLPPLHVENNGMDIRFIVWRSPSTMSDIGQGDRPAPTKKVLATTEKKRATTEKTTEKIPATTEKTPATTEKTTEKIIRLLDEDPTISMKALAEKCSMTEDGVFWHLKQLKAKGVIRRIGPDKGGHWEVLTP